MPRYAVALLLEKKEAGPYSRTVRTALQLYIVYAPDTNAAFAFARQRALTVWSVGGWQISDLSIEMVAEEVPAEAPSIIEDWYD